MGMHLKFLGSWQGSCSGNASNGYVRVLLHCEAGVWGCVLTSLSTERLSHICLSSCLSLCFCSSVPFCFCSFFACCLSGLHLCILREKNGNVSVVVSLFSLISLCPFPFPHLSVYQAFMICLSISLSILCSSYFWELPSHMAVFPPSMSSCLSLFWSLCFILSSSESESS